MTSRPIFIPCTDRIGVKVIDVSFDWNRGLALSQMRKNVHALHQAAIACRCCIKPLEISSRSEVACGNSLSAFNLTRSSRRGAMSVESIYQGSKVFPNGVGPFPEMYTKNPKEVRDFVKKVSDGMPIIGFSTGKTSWPCEPTRLFYDWVYCKTLYSNQELVSEASCYDAYTDIAFNPKKSVNCQAYAIALYMSMKAHGALDTALGDVELFRRLHPNENVKPMTGKRKNIEKFVQEQFELNV